MCAGALLGLVLLSAAFATAGIASVPGGGAVLVAEPGHGVASQPFTVTYTGLQHCTGNGWSQVDFYLDGALVGSASRLSTCSAALIVIPSALSPEPAPGLHLIAASLSTPSGHLAATGLSAAYVIDADVGGRPTPTPTPTPTASDSPPPTPSPTPAPSPSPATEPSPTPTPEDSPSPGISPSPTGDTPSPQATPPAGGGEPPPGSITASTGGPGGRPASDLGGSGGQPPERTSTIPFNPLPAVIGILGLLLLIGALLLARRFRRR